MDAQTDNFDRLRSRLFGIAYRMLGTIDDAEDVVQSAYLRWHQADGASVQNPEAWLVAVTTRLSIDRLRRASTERQAYVGDWLPEPLATGAAPADQRSELASDLSMAFLVLLERLSPDERAAFLLREVFGADYAEIARTLEKSEAACRQIVHRAKQRVRDERTRFPVPPAAKERLVRAFLAGLQAGDENALLQMVAEDAAWSSDGGGKVPAVHNLRGAAEIVRFLARIWRAPGPKTRSEIVWVNGEPAIANYQGDRLVGILSVDCDGEHVYGIYSVRNPDKLRHLGSAALPS